MFAMIPKIFEVFWECYKFDILNQVSKILISNDLQNMNAKNEVKIRNKIFEMVLPEIKSIP